MDLRIDLIPVESSTNIFLRDVDKDAITNVSDPHKITSGYLSGHRGFQVSSESTCLTKLDGNNFLYGDENYPGILSRQISDVNGNVDFAVNFEIIGDLPKYIYIGFDNVLKEYAVDFEITHPNVPNAYTVRGNQEVFALFDVSSIFSIMGGTYTLRITKWSKPDANVRVTVFSPTPSVRLTSRDIIMAEWSENALDDTMERLPGVCEQYADIQFYDRSGVITNLAREDVLKNKYKVNIIIDGTVTNTYIVRDWDIDTEDSVFILKGSDYYYQFSGINVPVQSTQTRTAYEMIRWIFSVINVPFTFGEISFAQPESLVTPDSWFYPSTVGEILTKICNAFSYRIFWLYDKYIIEELWHE